MKFKLAISSVIFFLLFLISCSSQFVVTQTPALTVKPTITNSPKSTSTINSTVTLSSPTFSPAQVTIFADSTRVARAMQTQENYILVAAPATLEARNVKCKDGFVLELGLDVIRVSNDKWTLFTCSPKPKNKDNRWTPGIDDYGTRYTQITRTDLSQTWTIKHSTFDYSEINRPDALMSPFRWTANGKYLYLYPDSYPDKSGFPQSAALRTHISSLYRINLETGVFELVLRHDQFGAIALSPNDQFLAYSERDKPDLIHIRNMENGNDLEVKLNENIIAAGAFIWDLESTKVVFTIGYGKQGVDWQDDLSGTSVYVLTPQNMHAQKILAKDSRIFIPYECSENIYWLNEYTICLYSNNHQLDSQNKIFTFNIKTGSVELLRSFP